MNLEDRNFEDIDINEEYEMIPFEPMIYGYGQMNAMPIMGMNPSMGMPMGYMQGVNPNIEMNPNMNMNPNMSMNQSNEDMFTNGFNSMAMMYGDASMKEYGDENEELRQMDKYGDKDPFKDGYNNPNKFNQKYNDVDSIVRRIERYNSAIFRLLTRCGMSYAEARDIVRRIVKLTLMYSEE
ncbi:hypothetical protein G9F72_018115 [Clostridium estertheticum]|uniref:hypothetical protein n=1 Tax=Clostridium estertheticum TaxID=238834 RepID=UPI0013E9162C|nr:hypothetical protein [Clostridium estertheticum]MBZ9688253.1 hypothetical protein [Clostridium estertheticum]